MYERFCVEQRVFIYNTLEKYVPWEKLCPKTCKNHPVSTVPYKGTIYRSGEMSNRRFSAGQK
jgi:hypothetical protein